MTGLTALQNAKAGCHADGRGLYLLVRPSGSRSWVLRTQVDGKRRDLGLGSTAKLSLAQARAKAADRRWLAADERGSIIAVTDDTGTTLGIDTYDEYGIPGAGNIGRFQYTGQAWLPEPGLYYYKARMYSPSLGRFMQTDPIGYADGLNWYNYVGSDPINFVDPLGLQIVVTSCRSGTIAVGSSCMSPSEFDQWKDALNNEQGGPEIVVTAKRESKGDSPQNVVSDVLNHDIGADIVVIAKKVPKPVQNFISDWVINYDCGFIDSSKCGASDYLSAALLLTGTGVLENTAIEGPKAALFKYGKGRAGQIRFFEDRLILRLDVNKPITHMNIQGRMFGVTFNFHFPGW